MHFGPGWHPLRCTTLVLAAARVPRSRDLDRHTASASSGPYRYLTNFQLHKQCVHIIPNYPCSLRHAPSSVRLLQRTKPSGDPHAVAPLPPSWRAGPAQLLLKISRLALLIRRRPSHPPTINPVPSCFFPSTPAVLSIP
ncbi:hypothetical protein BDW02DRAFT_566124, partial [Decorospora gaudefroyi]